MARRPLDPYAARRKFERTPEPVAAHPKQRQGPLLFVIQQHAARRLHFDFRLEVDGVLRSWAVPKGLTLDVSQKRLAVAVEDHPFDYGSFEGVIPAGEYGGGAVIVWDCGMYAPDSGGVLWDRKSAEDAARAGLAAGKLDFFLRGQKLKGAFVLLQTGHGKEDKKDEKHWLLIKQRDRFAREKAPPLPAASVLSAMTLEEMGAGPVPARIDAARLSPAGAQEALPARLSPMLAREADPDAAVRSDPRWLYEPKLDGYRVLAFVTAPGSPDALARVRLQSRGGIDLTAFFPEVVAELATQGASLIADGEVVALDSDGRPSFNALQRRAQPMGAAALAKARKTYPAVLVCFDLLHFAGTNVRGAPYSDRRRYLTQALIPGAHVQVIHASPDAEALYAAAIASGHEGIVAKRLDSPYSPGRRSGAWVKIKPAQTAELVVGGYTQGLGARGELGALLLGYWDHGQTGTAKQGAKLIYAGHVGSGLAGESIAALGPELTRLRTPRCPFATAPALHRPTTWVLPQRVVEVRFLAWTSSGKLRAPVFVRARPDIAAHRVRRPGAGAA